MICFTGLQQCSELHVRADFWSGPTTDHDFGEPFGPDHRNRGVSVDGCWLDLSPQRTVRGSAGRIRNWDIGDRPIGDL